MRIALALLSCAGLALLLALAILDQPTASANLISAVDQHMNQAGVEHPITAVLLNFRAYDTLLEIAVLLVAVVVGLSLRPARQAKAAARGVAEPSAMLPALARLLAPLMLLVAMYLLWAGSYQTGGAFQAGAVLAASALLLRLSGVTAGPVPAGRWLRAGLSIGFLVFLLAGGLMAASGRAFLEWPENHTGALILFIEAALTLSIALTLLGLFVSTPSPRSRPGEEQ